MEHLTVADKKILLELICNEQLKHMIPNEGYESNTYKHLEELKAKINNL